MYVIIGFGILYDIAIVVVLILGVRKIQKLVMDTKDQRDALQRIENQNTNIAMRQEATVCPLGQLVTRVKELEQSPNKSEPEPERRPPRPPTPIGTTDGR